MLNYKLSTSSWTHTHTTNVAHIYCVFTDKFFLKMQRASFLVSLSLSLCRTRCAFRLPFSFWRFVSLLSSLDCSCNGIFMQNNCLLSTAQQATARERVREAEGGACPVPAWTTNGQQLVARYLPLSPIPHPKPKLNPNPMHCLGPLKWL